MPWLDLLAAIALLLWGGRQMHAGLHELAPGWTDAALRHATRSSYGALAIGMAGGLLDPAARDRVRWTARLAGNGESLPLPVGYAVLLGANLGGALALLALGRAPDWAFHALVIAGAAAALLARSSRIRAAGRLLVATGLVLLAVQILALAAQPAPASALATAITQGLQQDMLLAMTAGALLALCLRSVLAAVLVACIAGGAWLAQPAAVAVLLGVQIGGSLLAHAGSARSVLEHRLAAGHLLATALAAAIALLLAEDLAHLLATLGNGDLLVLHVGFHAATAAAFLHLATPLAARMERWMPGTPRAGAAPSPRLDADELQVPSLALTSATREVMRVADLVEHMLRMLRQAFLQGDAAAIRAVREAEERVDTLYVSLKHYLAQIPRRPLRADELCRWEELMAFLIAAEQVGDRIERMLLDLEARMLLPRRSYPPRAKAEILALHERLAHNLRLAGGLCLERRLPAAAGLASARDGFREMERSFSAAHVARLVAGDAASVTVSSLHLDLLADLAQMNDQLCAFARFFLELRATVPQPLPSAEPPAGRHDKLEESCP